MTDRHDGWGTVSELDFIEKLGTFRRYAQDRRALLRGYYMAALQRVEWLGVDRDIILKRVKDELKIP